VVVVKKLILMTELKFYLLENAELKKVEKYRRQHTAHRTHKYNTTNPKNKKLTDLVTSYTTLAQEMR